LTAASDLNLAGSTSSKPLDRAEHTNPHLTMDSAPDLGVGWVIRSTNGEHQTLLFNDSGTYTFRVEQISRTHAGRQRRRYRRKVAALAVCIQAVG
jgi:hypothetical protein